MRHARSIVMASVAALLAASAGAQPASRVGPKPGTEVASLDLKLVPTGATRLLGEQASREIPLNAIKPTTIRKVPDGTSGARFAVISFGQNADGKPLRYAVLVTSDSVRVDANANNDLSDDQPITTQTVTADGKTRRTGTFQLPIGAESPVVDINFSAPDLAGAGKAEPLMISPNYAMTSMAKLGEQTYMVALVDGACDGTFAASKNPKIPGASIIIDRNANGRSDGLGEVFPAGQPFNISGVTYELRDTNAKMASAKIVVSQRRVDEVNPPSDLKVGSQCLSFEIKDTNDKLLHFPSDFKGQVVLLDFWATWCGPCMAELPNVIEAYSKYHKDGFEIVGVSLDSDASTVRSFARQRKVTWPMICDGKKWQAEIAKLYRVQGIPAMWLVDGDTGKILATSDTLRGEGALANAVQLALVAKEQKKMKEKGEGPSNPVPAGTNPATPATTPDSGKP